MFDPQQPFGWPPGMLVTVAFVFGALVGSFLNVVIARVPIGASVVWPPSHCFTCGKAIPPFHNVPILSWFLLRGRCSNCLARFSIRYALIELAFAVVCAFAVARHGATLPAAREILMMGFLIPLAAMDLDYWILPYSLTWSGTVVGLLLALAEGREPLLSHLLAAAVGFTGLMLVGFIGERILKKEAIGGGDPWLMGLIGAFLGMRSLLPVILLSSLQASIVGIALILARRRSGAHEGGEGEGEGEATSEAAPGSESLPNPVAVQHAASPDAPGAPDTTPAPAPQSAAAPTSREVAAGDEGDGWTPDPTAIPYGPFLAVAAAEILYFTELPRMLFPF